MNKLWMGVVVGAVVISGVLSASWVSAEQYDLKVGQVSATYSNESIGQNSISNKIAELLKQIGELQEKVAKLKVEQVAPSPDFGVPTEAPKERSEDDDYKFEKNLSFGAKNDKEVEKLQRFLLEKGYYSGPVTGNYLSLTLQAVKKFQRENGVEETGYLGPKTRAVLKSKVISCTVGQDCGDGTVKPIEHTLKIDTKSSLNSWVGKDFSAEFRVHGWNSSNSNLSVEGVGNIPGLSWAKSKIQCVMYPCAEDLIYLQGSPTQAGVYNVAVVAKAWSSGCSSSSGICPELAKQTGYGRAEFTVVINDSSSSNLPPVIDGIKGPTSLKVGEAGEWEIKAHDPNNGVLSYSVIWGDEVQNLIQSSAKVDAGSTSQKASFSHVYSRAGEYRVTFTVTDETGLKAASSLTTVVGGGSIQMGALKIDPSSAGMKVGESKHFTSWFDPAANCDGVKCPKMPVRQVETVWSLSAPDVAVIKPSPCPNLPNTGACLPRVTVQGAAPGNVHLIATYVDNDKVYTAKAYLSVASVPAPRGTLLIDPSSLKLQKGQSGTISSFFVPYVPPCSSNAEAPCLVAVKVPVEVVWSNSAPGRISLSCISSATGMSQDKLWQQCSGGQVSIGALAVGGAQVSASYKDSNGQVYTVAAPITVTDPNPVIGKLIIVPDSFSVGVGGVKTLSLFMEYPSSCPEGVVCTQLAPTPVKGTWSSSNNSVVKLACPPMPPCPAGMACIQVMPPCAGTTMNATGASQGTAKVIAHYVDEAGQYYLAESLATVSGTGTSSSTSASFNANQQTANVLQYLYETLLGMQSRFSH